MRMKSVRAFILFAVRACALAVAAAAQEGYPLAGTWYGDYGTGSQKSDLTVIMKWDGRNVTGTINPGPNATPDQVRRHGHHSRKAGARGPELDDGHSAGIPCAPRIRCAESRWRRRPSFEGTIQNPVAGNRRIAGTWTRGGEKGTFQLRRL